MSQQVAPSATQRSDSSSGFSLFGFGSFARSPSSETVQTDCTDFSTYREVQPSAPPVAAFEQSIPKSSAREPNPSRQIDYKKLVLARLSSKEFADALKCSSLTLGKHGIYLFERNPLLKLFPSVTKIDIVKKTPVIHSNAKDTSPLDREIVHIHQQVCSERGTYGRSGGRERFSQTQSFGYLERFFNVHRAPSLKLFPTAIRKENFNFPNILYVHAHKSREQESCNQMKTGIHFSCSFEPTFYNCLSSDQLTFLISVDEKTGKTGLELLLEHAYQLSLPDPEYNNIKDSSLADNSPKNNQMRPDKNQSNFCYEPYLTRHSVLALLKCELPKLAYISGIADLAYALIMWPKDSENRLKLEEPGLQRVHPRDMVLNIDGVTIPIEPVTRALGRNINNAGHVVTIQDLINTYRLS